MANPIIVIANFLTAVKSSWELSRMVREKRSAKAVLAEALRLLRLLKEAYRLRLIKEREFDYLYKRLLLADAKRDGRSAHRSHSRGLTSPSWNRM